MKKIGKVILYIFITFGAVLLLLFAVAALAEKKIVRMVVDQVSKTIDVPIHFDEIRFTLIHDFPYATIQCENFVVSSPKSINSGGADTLFFAEQLFISVVSQPLLKNIFDIRKVELSKAGLFYKVDTAGINNFDFLTDTTQSNGIDTAGNAIYLDINEFVINGFSCDYRDEKQKATANMFIEELTLSGLINNNHYEGEAEGTARLSNCTYGNTNLYKMQNAGLDFKLAYKNDLLTIDHAGIVVDADAVLSLQGLIYLADSSTTEMDLKAEKLDLGGLLKYIPENYLQEYGILELSGILAAETSISGLIADSVMPEVETTFDLTEARVQYQDYPKLKSITLKGKATNGIERNTTSSSVDIHSLSFKTDSSKVKLSGTVKNLDKPAYRINSTVDLDLSEMTAFIPDTLLQLIDGRVNAVISTKGILPESISESYIHSVLANSKVSAQCKNVSVAIDSILAVNHVNGQVEYEANEIKVKQMNAIVPFYNLNLHNVDLIVKGDPTNTDSLDIRFRNLRAAFDKSTFELDGVIRNPKTPNYSVTGQINIDLEEIASYLPDSLVNSISGNVSANFKSAAHLNLDSLSEQINELLFEKSNFTAKFDEVNVDMPDTTMNVSHLSGQLEYHSDTFQINQLELNYQDLQLGMNGVTATNVYSAVLQNKAKELFVEGSFRVGDLDYTFIEELTQLDTTRVEELEDEPLNFTYKIKGRFEANSIKYGDATFRNVDTKFLLKTSSYIFDSLKVNAFDGQSLSSVKIEMQPDERIDIFFKTDINKMDVSKMIKSFEQYIDYEDISSENILGIFSTEMDGKIVFQNFEPLYNSLLLKGNLRVENGALINVKPVMEVEKITGIGLKNMDRLYFSTLKSSVFLFDREIYIPRTEIKSSSFDAMFLGMYSFGEDYEYHIRMFLGEVLSSKSKANLRKQAQDDGFENDVETDEKTLTKGRTSIYVVSKSENGKEKAGFDKKHDRANMKAKVNLQKQMVDMRFHPTLVKYDTEE